MLKIAPSVTLDLIFRPLNYFLILAWFCSRIVFPHYKGGIPINKIDARGLTCPEPVILTKKELKLHPEGIEIIVDNEAAKINVERFLKISGYKIELEKRAHNDFLIIAEKS